MKLRHSCLALGLRLRSNAVTLNITNNNTKFYESVKGMIAMNINTLLWILSPALEKYYNSLGNMLNNILYLKFNFNLLFIPVKNKFIPKKVIASLPIIEV